jgi:hypothetical protein
MLGLLAASFAALAAFVTACAALTQRDQPHQGNRP